MLTEYGLSRVDARRPDRGTHFRQTYGRPYPVADETAYASWFDGPIQIAAPDLIQE